MFVPAPGRRSAALSIPLCLTVFLLASLCGMPAWAQTQTGMTKSIPVTIRDFNSSHPDFESPACYGGKNMIQPTLDADHKPFHLPSNFCADNKLQEWFRDSPSNTRYCQDLTLTQKAGSENIFEKTDDLFFPIDNVPTKEATIPGEDNQIHNFHFCMEMHATFKYRGAEVFNFEGDDDVWVFINGKLALDLGGVHTPQKGLVDLDAGKSALGISTGNYYAFDFFFCERQTIGSHLKMNTSIDIIPPPAPGYHIADANLNLLVKGDTLVLPQGDGKRVFNGVEIKSQSQTIDCSNVTSQVKSPIAGDWTFGGKALPNGSSVDIDPDAYPVGLGTLVFNKNGMRDSVVIRILPLSQVAMPVADPAGTTFPVRLDVALTTTTSGAVIRYTLDGSTPTETSLLYAGPLRLETTTVLKAIATKPGMKSSPVMTENYFRKTSHALKGHYQDLDGDGRIETAVIAFDESYTVPPQILRLTDPFASTRVVGIVQGGPDTGARIATDPASRTLTATFPPFAAGTGFTPARLAEIPAVPGVFDAQTVLMDDSVGPVLVSAKSFPALPGGAAFSALEVVFSEPVALDTAAAVKIFPFDAKRNSLPIDKAMIRVQSIAKLGPDKYRIAFMPGSKYPVPRDSLKIDLNAGVTDATGNASRMSYYIPVAGDPIRAIAEITMTLEKGLTRREKLQAQTGAHAILVHTGTQCLNCQDPSVKPFLPTTLPVDLTALGPTWKVSTRYPFLYNLAFFNNLGQFVNKAQGEVTASQILRAQGAGSPNDSSYIRLTFLPFATDGNAIATGAYIMKATLNIPAQPVFQGSQGEDLIVAPTSTTMVSRFGYIRE
jgi:fibro-slime domain-containing protein